MYCTFKCTCTCTAWVAHLNAKAGGEGRKGIYLSWGQQLASLKTSSALGKKVFLSASQFSLTDDGGRPDYLPDSEESKKRTKIVPHVKGHERGKNVNLKKKKKKKKKKDLNRLLAHCKSSEFHNRLISQSVE